MEERLKTGVGEILFETPTNLSLQLLMESLQSALDNIGVNELINLLDNSKKQKP